jgi:hypothetical protein
MKKIYIKISAVAVILFAVAGCKKEVPLALATNGNMSVELTEKNVNPLGNYSSIILDIKEVDIQYTSKLDGNWTPLQTNAGSYDILQLKNNISATIAGGKYPIGIISAVRLMLGEKNSVTVSGDGSHSLEIPDNLKTGIVFTTNTEISTGNYLLTVLTIDASKAVLFEQGVYTFRPAIVLKNIIK